MAEPTAPPSIYPELHIATPIKTIYRRLAVNAQKHDEIKLAESKANSIASHVSAALKDGNVSDEEFKLITEAVERYKQMKAHLRAGACKKHTEVLLYQETKKCPPTARRDEAHNSFLKKAEWTVKCSCVVSDVDNPRVYTPPEYEPCSYY
ncbi:hypothetical protein CAPTEDRAFT_201439 [Capitella teleta]|uniref:Uncharacterized protein n=1 Tax=Capitella teleta TaxID=283909 RepID=R7T3V0_CAPTE|nr:hypothetical protein CAPTEDRAFT_201439 [Capitella teleta]|eukprot:ELT87443.1 hypothetical protein CAPTEDRAFT_201439 [Capitella teleta]